MRITKELIQEHLQSLDKYQCYGKLSVTSIINHISVDQDPYVDFFIEIIYEGMSSSQVRYVGRDIFNEWLKVRNRNNKITNIIDGNN